MASLSFMVIAKINVWTQVRGLLLPWKPNWILEKDLVNTSLKSDTDKAIAKHLKEKSRELHCFAKALHFCFTSKKPKLENKK